MRSKIILAGLIGMGLVACSTGSAGEPVPEPVTIDHFTERDARAVERYIGRIETAYGWALMTNAWWGEAAVYAGALVDAEKARLAAEAAERASASSGSYSGSRTFVGSGDCYASDLPDYIVSRESGGDPNAYNPSGAWGCAQFMPGTWNASCSDLGAHGSASVEAQNECANRVWAGGAGSSHWAATR